MSARTIRLACAAWLACKLQYDPVRDFLTASLLSINPTLLVAHPSLTASMVHELVALASNDVIDALVTQGVEPGYGSPSEFEAFIKADAAMWGKLVKESGIKPE